MKTDSKRIDKVVYRHSRILTKSFVLNLINKKEYSIVNHARTALLNFKYY